MLHNTLVYRTTRIYYIHDSTRRIP